MVLAAPVMLAHGSDELRQRFIRPTVTGEITWVPAVQRAGRGLRPGRPYDDGGR